jgi:type II secretory ATPase GspE/PulE/Tfp pilus assembly ATPase PilB-like protein
MQAPRQRPRLGESLLQSGSISTAQLEEALAEQVQSGERLGRCLVRLGHISEDTLLGSLARQLNLARLDLQRLRVPPEAARLLPLDFVRRHRVLAIETQNGSLRLATSDPGNRRLIDDVRLLSGLEVEEAIASEREITEKIAECFQITVERMIEDFGDGHGSVGSSENLHDIEVMASEPTVVNLVNLIISSALKERASDIHLVPFEKSLELRYRVDGLLREIPPPPKHLHAALVSRVKIMADMNIAERFLPQDGHIQIQHTGCRVDIRVGTMPTIYGESLVMRLLEKDSRVLSLEELGLDPERVDLLSRAVETPHGIVLATGPTGCGKTTTLYSILNRIYTPEKKVLTIEDPVEYELPGVAQIPVRPARGFTFATGLRAIVRQDPDIIMVGEIRDSETAEIAIRAALTGHLVFSTLHTNDAAGAVTRLLDMGVEAFLIASSLEAVLAQRLVRTVCAACKEEAPLSVTTLAKLEALRLDPGPGPYYRGAGCEDCRGTGFRGRTGIFELLRLRTELREMILARRPSTEIKAAALEDMLTLRQDGWRKAASGLTSLDEVLRVAMDDVLES